MWAASSACGTSTWRTGEKSTSSWRSTTGFLSSTWGSSWRTGITSWRTARTWGGGGCKQAPASFTAQCMAMLPGHIPEMKQKRWLVDSGCNRHMTPHVEDLVDTSTDDTACTFGDGKTVKAKARGNVVINCEDSKGENRKVILSDVLYMPSLSFRMFSSGRLRNMNGVFIERKGDSHISLPVSKAEIPLTESDGFLWLPESKPVEPQVIASTVYAPGSRGTAEASMIDWHETLGHSYPASILFLEQRGLIRVRGVKSLDDFNCRVCKEAKSTIPHYQRGTRCVKAPGETVHIDLVGPFEADMNGYKYMMVFIDEATRFKSVLGLINKGGAYTLLKTYIEGIQEAASCTQGNNHSQDLMFDSMWQTECREVPCLLTLHLLCVYYVTF